MEAPKEAPKVYCKKEDRDVPIWWCLGSFIQGRITCIHNAGGIIHYGKTAETYCDYRRLLRRWTGVRAFAGSCVVVSLFSIIVTDMSPILWAWFFGNLGLLALSFYKIWMLKK